MSWVAFAGLGEAGVRTDVNVCLELISVLTMMLLPKQLNYEHSLMPHRNQDCGLLTALEELTYLLHAATLTQIYQKNKFQHKKTNRKEQNIFDSRKGKKEGGREEGRKEGRQEARNSGLAPRCCVHLPIYTCYFQTAASPTQFTCVGFKMW